MALTRRFEGEAVLAGAAIAVAICFPLALLGQVLADDADPGDPPSLVYLLFIGVLLGFAVGGFVAARRGRESPYTNGALAALAAFVVIQGAALLARAFRSGDNPVTLATVVFDGLVAYASGATGAHLAARRR